MGPSLNLALPLLSTRCNAGGGLRLPAVQSTHRARAAAAYGLRLTLITRASASSARVGGLSARSWSSERMANWVERRPVSAIAPSYSCDTLRAALRSAVAWHGIRIEFGRWAWQGYWGIYPISQGGICPYLALPRPLVR